MLGLLFGLCLGLVNYIVQHVKGDVDATLLVMLFFFAFFFVFVFEPWVDSKRRKIGQLEMDFAGKPLPTVVPKDLSSVD